MSGFFTRALFLMRACQVGGLFEGMGFMGIEDR